MADAPAATRILRVRTRIVVVLATVGLSGLLLTTGCSYRENICADGEYPVIAVGPDGGRACLPDGQEPTAPYVRFPADKVPQHVDDEWDVYWRTHGIDENGAVIET
ncbi:hypothetical protein GCM10022379_40060 [Micromonospora maritima]